MRGASTTNKCSCLPKWLSSCIQDDEDGRPCCAGCKTSSIPEGGFLAQNIIAYTCYKTRERVHVFNVVYHVGTDSRCMDSFNDMLSINNRHSLIERVPFMEFLDAAKVRKEHQQTGLICDGCQTGEQSHAKFKSCSRCKQVRYCSKECQMAMHATHKGPCKEKVAAMLEAQHREPQKSDSVVCGCFNKEDRRIFEKSENGICCAVDCNIPVGGSVVMSCYVTECTLPSSQQPFHMMQTVYCSQHCLKTVMNKKKI